MRYAVCLLFAFSALTLSLGGLSQASEEAGPDDPEEPKDQRQSVVLGVVSLKPKGGVDSLATGTQSDYIVMLRTAIKFYEQYNEWGRY